MKLIFLSHESCFTGGAQKCLLDLLKGIKHAHPAWQIYMVFPKQGDFLSVCSEYLEGYKILPMRWWLVGAKEDLTLKKKLSYYRKLWNTTLRLACYLKKIKPDYGITNTIVVPHLALACKMLNIKHCWFIHEVPTATWNDIKFILKPRFVFKLVNSLSFRIFVTSEYAKHYYQNKMKECKVFTITQAVGLEAVSGVKMNRDLHKRYTLLMVGAFDSNKGQLELLHAVKIITDAGRNVYCYLVGPDSGFRTICESYIEENHLCENVRVVSFVEQVYPYYYAADVLLSCSVSETFNRVAVEAQMCGLPVILSNVGANPERIEDGVSGLLYQKGNVMDLVEKIERLRDVAVRKSMASHIASARIVEKYSIDNFASDFCALLKLQD